jgi:ElaB/YqjD/DUF883 family membrane-anchored ribosome-binding protein
MAEENQMKQGAAVSPLAGASGGQSRRQQPGSRADDRGHMTESGGMQDATKKLTPVARVTGGEVLNDARQRLRTLKEDTDEYVRKNPARAVFTALGVGFVLGLMRRR